MIRPAKQHHASGYAMAIHRLGDALRGSRVRRSIEAATGTVLVALGLRLATEQHRP
jgi:threonine/homoserine/homoserine lactone efflux protein